MSWNNVCVEGFCFGECENGEYPCGQRYPTAFCLNNRICPHFNYAETSEREASLFVPLRLILRDRFTMMCEDIGGKLRWWFWDRLWFNVRKTQEYFDSIKTIGSDECEALKEFEEEDEEEIDKFPDWFKGAMEEEVEA